MSLADGKLAHQAQPHKLLPRAFLCIAVSQVPTSCLVWWSGSVLGVFVIAGCSSGGWMVGLFPSGEVILFVADHLKLGRAHKGLYCNMSVDASLLTKNVCVLWNSKRCSMCATTLRPVSVTTHLGYPVCLARIPHFWLSSPYAVGRRTLKTLKTSP